MDFWTVPKMWEGGDVWIIGGGSSFPRQFGIPEKVIQAVEKGEEHISIYSEYLAPLHDKNVVGVNISFLLGNWISALYFCDAQFFRVYQKSIVEFPNLKVTCIGHLDRRLQPLTTNIKRLKRDEGSGLSKIQSSIRWNHNSGAAAINFAVLAGARRILLLGFDMAPNEGVTHWHKGYQLYDKPTTPNVFKRFMKVFPGIAEDARRKGIEILNVNPDSNLPDFKKVSLNSVL